MREKVKTPTGKPELHGGFSIIVKGPSVKQSKKLRQHLMSARKNLVDAATKGQGESMLSVEQTILIDRIVTKLGICRQIEESAREHGVFDGERNFRPSLGKNYISYCNSIRRDLGQLNIKEEKIRPRTGLELAAEVDAEIAAEKK